MFQFQYGNPDILCKPIVKAKKDGEDLVVCFSNSIHLLSPKHFEIAKS
jgi:hypothetical protein